MPKTADRHPSPDPFFLRPASDFGKPVCRLGLASRGEGALSVDDVHLALERGVNVLNWPGVEDHLGRAIAGLGPRRDDVVIVTQFEARTAADAAHELPAILATLRTD